MHVRRLIPVALAATTFAAGCGGDDKKSSEGSATSTEARGYSTALTKDEFVKQGTAICQDAAKRATANATKNADDPVALVTEAAAAASDTNKRYHALTPPEEFAKDWTSFLALQDQAVALSEKTVELSKDQSNTKLKDEVEQTSQDIAANVQPKIDALREKFGFDC